MRFAPDPDSERVRLEAARVAEEICAPDAAVRDESRAFPGEEIARLGQAGWLGMTQAPEAGGRGLDRFCACLVIAELSRACASVGLLAGFHNLLVCDGIAGHGSKDVKETLLPRLAKGEIFGAAALSDPATTRSGEEPAQAVLTEEGYRLQGTKPFVPGAVGADLFLVYAHNGEPETNPTRGRVLLVVPRETEGLEIGKPDPLVGVRASGTARLRFNGCLVPASLRLDGGEEARAIVKRLLVSANLVVAAQAVGIATAALETAVGRAGEREPTDRLVGSHQSVQFLVADMAVALDAARLHLYRASQTDPIDSTAAYRAAQAKALAGRAAVQIADAAIQVLGGDGSLADHGIERHWRDAKTCELNPSTREAAYLVVADHLLEEEG